MGTSKKGRSPAYQHYPDKAMSGSQHLSPEAFKAYWLMLWWMWQHSDDYCSVADHPGAWAIAMQTDTGKASTIMDELMQDHMPLLKRERKRLVSGGLKKEAKKQRERRRQTSDAAKVRWHKDMDGMQPHSERKVPAMRNTCPPTPTPTPTPTTAIQKNKRKSFVKPTPAEVVKYAKTIGFKIDGEAFCSYYESRGWMLGKVKMVSWESTVVTWKKNDQKRNPDKKKPYTLKPGQLAGGQI